MSGDVLGTAPRGRDHRLTLAPHPRTCLIYLDEANEALHHWHKSLQIAEEIEDVPNQIDLVNKLGALFEQHGEHHRAIGCLNKLLQIHHEEGDKDAELAVLGSLASISYETEVSLLRSHCRLEASE